MHGGKDRKDGTDIAGTWIKIHHNTFWPKHRHVIGIYGTPEQNCHIYLNWFPNHNDPKFQSGKPAVIHGERTFVENNKYGR